MEPVRLRFGFYALVVAFAATSGLLSLRGVAGTDASVPTSEFADQHPEMLAPAEATSTPLVKKDGDNEWILAPIPSLTPSQGWGIKLFGGYVFKPAGQGPEVPPSRLGIGGFYTEQKSYGIFAGYQGHLAEDKWRVSGGGGFGQLNYDFYGIGTESAEAGRAIPIEQKATFAMAQALRRFRDAMYGGLRMLYIGSDIGADFSQVIAPAGTVTGELNILGLAPTFQWDTRDNQFYPTQGRLMNVTFTAYDEAWGSDYDFASFNIAYNHYRSFGDNAVLATRLYAQHVDGDPPFFALSSFGQHNDLRGYKGGKFRDNFMIACQAEWRQQFTSRWGGVVFAGLGEIAPKAGELTADNVLWSGGAGIRFRIAKKNPINLRFDWAYGDESTFYLGVGEAF